MDNVTAAKQLIPLLDLTTLSSSDTEYSVADFCHRAITPYGNTASVCVYSRFVPIAKQELHDTEIKIATVVNFPSGEQNLKKITEEISFAINNGADEIDAVFPYKKFLAQEYQVCEEYLKTIRNVCHQKTLKIILETGELKSTSLIQNATILALNNGADFIKTSTGKTKTSATPEAANIILETLNSSKYKAGFKASGGIKTTMDAKQYLILADTIMGNGWISPQKFRIGASSLLDDLLETIKRGF